MKKKKKSRGLVSVAEARATMVKAGLPKKRKTKKISPIVEKTEIKPIPRTVNEAWDAMKAAQELPRCYRSASVPPTPVLWSHLPKPNGRPSSVILQERIDAKVICSHKRDNGTLCISWMRHSNNQILGVCGSCGSQFDTRNESDLQLYRENPKASRNMGYAGDHAFATTPFDPEIILPVSRWQKIKNFFKKIVC